MEYGNNVLHNNPGDPSTNMFDWAAGKRSRRKSMEIALFFFKTKSQVGNPFLAKEKVLRDHDL